MSAPDDYRKALFEFRERFLREHLARAGGKVALAARKAGLHRSTFHKFMVAHGIPRQPRPRVNRGNAAWQSLAQ